MSEKKVTFNDIARYTNFSKTTISRYFNHPESLTKENRETIRRALDELGYHENKIARLLASGKTEFIGLIIPNLFLSYYSELLVQILSTYEAFGYKFLVYVSNGNRESEEQYLQELESVFAELPVTRIPWYPSEIRGMEAVEKLSHDVMNDPYLFDRPVRTDNEIYAPIQDGYSLTVRVPGALQEDVEIFMRDMDVDIKIRNYMRSIPLPGVLRGAKLSSYTLQDGSLTICFAVKENS